MNLMLLRASSADFSDSAAEEDLRDSLERESNPIPSSSYAKLIWGHAKNAKERRAKLRFMGILGKSMKIYHLLAQKPIRAFFYIPLIAAMISQGNASANMGDSTQGSALKIEALCTIANKYEVCHPQIRKDKLIINFPTELVIINRDDIEYIKVYDSRKREIFKFNQKVGDVDFAISFDDGYGVRTGFIRFKNNKSAERFNNYLNTLILR